jgi:hypothetical protein
MKKIFAVAALSTAFTGSAMAQEKADKHVYEPAVCTLKGLPAKDVELGTELAPFYCPGYGEVIGSVVPPDYRVEAKYPCSVTGWPTWPASLAAHCRPSPSMAHKNP